MLVVFAAVIAVLVVRPVRTVKAQPGCSNRTLMGNYGWTEFGHEPESEGTPFWTMVGLVQFDGNGNFSGSNIYYIENGTPDPANPSSVTGGTYTVNSNCAVTITYSWEGETYTDHGLIVDAVGGEVIADEYSSDNDTTGHVDVKKIWGGG
jgi:hypothetical protein